MCSQPVLSFKNLYIVQDSCTHAKPLTAGVAVSPKSSQLAETNETIFRDGQGFCQRGERRESGLRRVVSGVSGVLRTTREVADAAVQRARRFFFRDAG